MTSPVLTHVNAAVGQLRARGDLQAAVASRRVVQVEADVHGLARSHFVVVPVAMPRHRRADVRKLDSGSADRRKGRLAEALGG